MPFFKTGIKKRLVFGALAFLLIVCVSSPFILTKVINTPYIKNKLSVYIYQKAGVHIDASRFSLTLFPHTSLTITDFNYAVTSTIDAAIDSLKLNIDIQKLLQGNIDINHISIDHPKIKIQSRPGTITKDRLQLPDNFFITDPVQALAKIFDYLPVYQDSVEIRFKNASSPYFRQMDGSFYLSKTKKEILLTTSIKDIIVIPSTLSPVIFKKYLDIKSIKLHMLKLLVKFNSKGEINGQCTFITPELMSHDNHLLFDSKLIELSFKLSDGFYKIDVKPFKSSYPEGSVSVRFINDELKKKSEINFSGTYIHIDQARKMALALFKDNTIVQTLFGILKEGVVPNVNVSFQSKYLTDLFQGNNLSLKANIKNGSVTIPATNLTASKVTGNATIHEGLLDITADNAMIQTSKVGKSRLTIDLLHPTDFPFQGEFLLDADLSMVPQTLISLLPGTLLAKELSLVHAVSGRSKTKLKLCMKPDSPDLLVNITTEDFSVKGIYDRIPGNIFLENINISYEPDRIDVTRLNGVINGSTIYDLNTTFTFKKNPFIAIQSGSGRICLDSMIPWLMSFKKTRNLIAPVTDGKGEVFVTSIDLSGPVLNPNQWKFNLKGIGTGIDLATYFYPKQIQNMSWQYHLSENLLAIQKMQMKINDLSFMKPFIAKKHLDSIRVPFDLKNGDFQMTKKQCLFQGDFKFPGGPKLFIGLKGETLLSMGVHSINFFDPKFSNGTIRFNPHKDDPLFEFTGTLCTQTLDKMMVPGSFWAKKINDFTEGQPVVLKTDKDSSLTIITKSIDLNPLFAHTRNPSMVRRLLPEKIINFKADQVKIKNLTLTNIDGKLSLRKGHSNLKFNNALLCGLNASGYINLKNNIIYVNFPIEAHDKKNIQDLLTCLFQKNDFMDGQYSLTASLMSNGTRKDLLNNFSGSLNFKAKKGRIYKFTLLSRILSVLNISKIFKGNIPDVIQKGFGYNKISIETDIRDSRIYLTKAIIDGQDMTLIFSGWIDPVKDEMDLVCLVAPFKTIDLIIEHIPIINTLLGGRLVSIPVKATGKISDPDVIPLHPSAVGKGLVNMMSDILKTPVKLWDKIYGQ